MAFVKVYESVLKRHKVGYTARVAYCVLKSYAERYPRSCFPSVPTLGKTLGLSNSQTVRSLGQLRRAEWIKRQRRKRHSNIYTVGKLTKDDDTFIPLFDWLLPHHLTLKQRIIYGCLWRIHRGWSNRAHVRVEKYAQTTGKYLMDMAQIVDIRTIEDAMKSLSLDGLVVYSPIHGLNQRFNFRVYGQHGEVVIADSVDLDVLE